MKKIMITGASGMIGRSLLQALPSECRVLGLYHTHRPNVSRKYLSVAPTDIVHPEVLGRQVQDFGPDILIHCAAIAHQSLRRIDRAAYFSVNTQATRELAEAAGRANPEVHFIFLSTVSVYGEDPAVDFFSEESPCRPTSDYGESKLAAEKQLHLLADQGTLQKLTILRLGPVYDADWSYNLKRRVLAPFEIAYLRFGRGRQRMSALAKPNLIDFFGYLIRCPDRFPQQKTIMNICDKRPYAFREIIKMFQDSLLFSPRPVIPVPLFSVKLLTRLLGLLFPSRRAWIFACYEKLSGSIVFDNQKMLATGFNPVHNLETVFGNKN